MNSWVFVKVEVTGVVGGLQIHLGKMRKLPKHFPKAVAFAMTGVFLQELKDFPGQRGLYFRHQDMNPHICKPDFETTLNVAISFPSTWRSWHLRAVLRAGMQVSLRDELSLRMQHRVRWLTRLHGAHFKSSWHKPNATGCVCGQQDKIVTGPEVKAQSQWLLKAQEGQPT